MHSFAWWPTVIVSVIATFTDLRSRRIPNWLVAPFFVIGIAASAWLNGWHGLAQSLEGAALGLVTFGILFVMGGMGAGDVKLFAAIGAWIGPGQLFIALVLTGLAGGVMVLGWAVVGGFLGDLFQGTGNLVANLAKGKSGTEPSGLDESHVDLSDKEATPATGGLMKRKMPYAPAIAIGSLLSFFAH